MVIEQAPCGLDFQLASMSWKTGPSNALLQSLLEDPEERDLRLKREREEREQRFHFTHTAKIFSSLLSI
jgi:hypothetical protein